MKKFLLLISLIVLCLPVSTQNFNYYEPITARGDIPLEFRTLSSEKFEAALQTMSKEGKRFERKAREQFHLESNFLIDELLMSGRVLFNDTVSQYVNSVAEIALSAVPRLYEQLRIYVVNSPAVNAFTTNNGNIFINMGLLAKLESEAQLAFIICHEAIHYKNKHVIKSYVHNKKMDKDPGLFKQRPSLDDRLMAKSNYSIQNELEADAHAMDFYLASDYDPDAAISAFELLKTSDLPFEPMRPFSIDALIGRYLNYDTTYTLDTLYREAIQSDNDDRKYLTHPDVNERLTQGSKLLDNRQANGNRKFIIGQEAFEKINKIARFELCRLFLISRDYERSLYCAYNLLRDDPGSYFLNTTVMRSIYGSARLHQSDEYHKLVRKVRYNPLPIQPYSHFLTVMPAVSGNLIATEMTLALLDRMPGDHANQLILNQLIDDNLEAADDEQLVMTADTNVAVDSVINLLQADFPGFAETYQTRAEKARASNKKKPRSRVRKSIVLDPVVYKIDLRNDNPVSYLDSEESLLKFNEYIMECADKAGINIEMVKTTGIKTKEIEAFNNARFFKRFRDDKFMDEADIVSVDHNRCMEISRDYGSDYLSFIGSVELKDRKANGITVLAVTCLYFPLLPFGLIYALTPERGYMNFVVVFDIEQDTIKTSTYHTKRSAESKANVKSSLYYNFLKLKQ